MELPPPKAKDEDNAWSQEDEDNFNGFNGFFEPLLETVRWKRNSGNDDEEYYPYAYLVVATIAICQPELSHIS